MIGALITKFPLFTSKRNREPEQYFPLVSAVTILNAIVVFLYLKLYFTVSKPVNCSRSIVWYREYYLHLVGLVILIVDSLFFIVSFRQIHKCFLMSLRICLLHIFWSKILISPLNNTPQGSVSNGLPNPFLNDMHLQDSVELYLTTITTALAFYLVGWNITKVRFRSLSPQDSLHFP